MTVPTLAQVLREAIEQRVASLRVSLPARVVSFDAAEQTAEVQPLIADTQEDDSGNTVNVELPVISGVPVQFTGGGGFADTYPVAQGDPCWLIFSDRSIDDWFARGEKTTPTETRRHHETDAIALLGVRSQPAKLAEFDTSRRVVGNKGPRVAFDGQAVHLGVAHNEDAQQDTMRGTQFNSDLSTLLDQIDTAATNAQTQLNIAGAGANALTSATPGSPVAGAAVVGAGLIAAAAALAAIPTAIATFKAQQQNHVTPKVKVI